MKTFYRALLRLYPASFRADYAGELARVFAQTVRDRGRLAAALGAIADVVANPSLLPWTLLIQDLRHSVRTLNGSRGFALAAVMITALGVGANTATFSVADFVLFRPLPFPEPDTLVRVCEGPRLGGGWGCNNQMSPAMFRDV